MCENSLPVILSLCVDECLVGTLKDSCSRTEYMNAIFLSTSSGNKANTNIMKQCRRTVWS